jgi:hypothetical protein
MPHAPQLGLRAAVAGRLLLRRSACKAVTSAVSSPVFSRAGAVPGVVGAFTQIDSER